MHQHTPAIDTTTAQHLERFQELQIDDLSQVIAWLEGLLEAAHGGNSTVAWNDVVSQLALAGFEANVNVGDGFDASDMDNYGRFLIGQFMSLAEAPMLNILDNVFAAQAQQWRVSFALV